MTSPPVLLSAGAATVTIEIEIAAAPATTWAALVEDIGAWWRGDFLVCAGSTMTLEPKVGGLLFEQGPVEGTGFVWGQIIRYEPDRHLAFTAQIVPPWGGPAHSVVQISLQARADDPGKTLVTLADSLVGHLDDEALSNMDEGWRMLFGEGGLKTHLESRPPDAR